MKLKNKKTGEIRKAVDIDMYSDSVYLKVCDGEFDNETIKYHSLAELNEEWEDYHEEPKEYWHIFGTNITKTQEGLDEVYDKRNKEIGNYFENKEEAEKAVECLRAWKRLKDKGFRFEYYDYSDRDLHNHIQIKAITNREVEDSMLYKEDLDLLFSGEDD